MELRIHPQLRRRGRQLPAAVAELGHGRTSFLIPLNPEAYLYPWEMFRLLEHFKKWSIESDRCPPKQTSTRRPLTIFDASIPRSGKRSPKWRRGAAMFVRDLAIFAMNGDKWRFDEIANQLEYMGLPSITSKQKKFNICHSVRELLRKMWTLSTKDPHHGAETVFGNPYLDRSAYSVAHNPFKRVRRRLLQLQGCPLHGRPPIGPPLPSQLTLFRLEREMGDRMVTLIHGDIGGMGAGGRVLPNHPRKITPVKFYRGKNGLPTERRSNPGIYGELPRNIRRIPSPLNEAIIDYDPHQRIAVEPAV